MRKPVPIRRPIEANRSSGRLRATAGASSNESFVPKARSDYGGRRGEPMRRRFFGVIASGIVCVRTAYPAW